MVFQYTPAKTTPGQFSGGPNHSALAQLIAGRYNGFVQGMNVLGAAIGNIKTKQLEEEKQEFIGSLGQRASELIETKSDPAYTYMEEWNFLGDKEESEMTGVVGGEGPELGTKTITKKSGFGQFMDRLEGVPGMTTDEKMRLYRKLNGARERRVVNMDRFNALTQEASRYGLTPVEVAKQLEPFMGDASMGTDGRDGLKEDIRREIKDQFGDLDQQAQHPISAMLSYDGLTPQQQDREITGYLQRLWPDKAMTPDQIAEILPGARLIFKNHEDQKTIDAQLRSLMGFQMQGSYQMPWGPVELQEGANRPYTWDEINKLMSTHGALSEGELRELATSVNYLGTGGGKAFTFSGDTNRFTSESYPPEIVDLLNKGAENLESQGLLGVLRGNTGSGAAPLSTKAGGGYARSGGQRPSGGGAAKSATGVPSNDTSAFDQARAAQSKEDELNSFVGAGQDIVNSIHGGKPAMEEGVEPSGREYHVEGKEGAKPQPEQKKSGVWYYTRRDLIDPIVRGANRITGNDPNPEEWGVEPPRPKEPDYHIGTTMPREVEGGGWAMGRMVNAPGRETEWKTVGGRAYRTKEMAQEAWDKQQQGRDRSRMIESAGIPLEDRGKVRTVDELMDAAAAETHAPGSFPVGRVRTQVRGPEGVQWRTRDEANLVNDLFGIDTKMPKIMVPGAGPTAPPGPPRPGASTGESATEAELRRKVKDGTATVRDRAQLRAITERRRNDSR